MSWNIGDTAFFIMGVEVIDSHVIAVHHFSDGTVYLEVMIKPLHFYKAPAESFFHTAKEAHDEISDALHP